MVFRLQFQLKKGYPLFSRLKSRKIQLESIFTTFLNGHTISSTGKAGKTCGPDQEIRYTPFGQRLPHRAIYQKNPNFIRTLTELDQMRTKPKRIRPRKTPSYEKYLTVSRLLRPKKQQTIIDGTEEGRNRKQHQQQQKQSWMKQRKIRKIR